MNAKKSVNLNNTKLMSEEKAICELNCNVFLQRNDRGSEIYLKREILIILLILHEF